MLSLHNVTKTYQNGHETLHALNQVSLSFKPGDVAFLLGASGSGKSTLLNILSGLDTPTEGKISIDGIDTKNFSKKQWAIYRNHYIGFIFQEYNLIEHLTALENVALPLIFQGVSQKEAQERARIELEKIGLAKHIDKKPLSLSGGQQQRVAIARAFVTNPKVIMADEPTGALDIELGKKVIEYLIENAKDKVVIVVTHDEDLSNAYANRVVKIADGHIVEDSNQTPLNVIKEGRMDLVEPKMRLSLLFKFAKNNIASRMFRNILTSAIVSIGFIAILLLTFMIGGISGSITDTLAMIIPPDEYHIHHLEDTNITHAHYDRIRDYDGIETLRYNISASLDSEARQNRHTFIYEPMPLDQIAFERDGDFYGELPENDDEVVISLRTALQIRDMQSIDEDSYEYLFNLVDGLTIDIMHDQNRIETVTIVGMAADNMFASPMVYMLYDALLDVVETTDPSGEHTASLVATLNIRSESEIQTLTQTLYDEEDLIMRNVFGEMTGQIESVMNNALRWFIGVALITLIVSGILIGLVLYTSVLERIREIGILTALGARSKNIRMIFLLESGLSGLMSALIAIAASIGIASFLNRLFNSFIQTPLNLITGGNINFTLLSPGIIPILIVLVAGVVYAMFAGAIPSQYASKLNAVHALRKE